MEKLDRKRGNRYISRRSSAKGFPSFAISITPSRFAFQRAGTSFYGFPGRYLRGLPRPRRSVGSGDAVSHSLTWSG